MMMNEPCPEEAEARRFFEMLGLTVTPIATTSTRTPDLQVDGDRLGYFVEVKRRTDSEEFARALRDLGDGEQTRPLGVDPNLKRALDSAHDQLRRLDSGHDRLWIVWLAVDVHAGAVVGIETVAGTLFGVKQAILPAEHGDGAISIDCYYARPGSFERRPDLDAVIVSVSNGCLAFVNELSPRSDQVVTARVAQRLAERRALVIPSHREAEGNCLLADRALDRRNEGAVVDDLRRRYGRPVLCLAEPEHCMALTHVRSNPPGPG